MNTQIPEHFRIPAHSKADPRAVVLAPQARFTVLSSCLIRMEYSPNATFEDAPTQVFWHREQPVPVFEVRHEAKRTEIITEYLHLKFQHGGGFTPETLTVQVMKADKTWTYGQADWHNLKGTGRTLDMIDGAVPLEDGLMSRSGWHVVDDTKSLIFNPAGWLEPRNAPEGYLDLYFFGHGTDYQATLADYCRIADHTPLIPRWVLGNWWSRYWEFSQEELGALMKEFQAREVPLSVCIIDMDWHITDIGTYPGGWTGYTWNEKLFPDYKGFIKFLHTMGLRTALNLHPASGVLAHEAMYPQMAKATGIDPATKEPVKFDLENPGFLNPYFEYLHHPYEADGIDFWWMDWQQGNPTSLGINLLWWINHLHFFDLGREKQKRPFVFSRWGGLGNHRYPIGFSGDSMITWNSLAFQPYMTATAANVGFGWWSHDIGGHMGGIQEAELYARWVQLGVFSPVLRLHSTKNPFLERRPWGYDAETFRVTQHAMQLRHALIPYLYSMAWKNATRDIPLVRPMYYLYPEQEEAYLCPNQYAYGSELIAAPFITPSDPDTLMSRQVVWLPEGDWFDFFNGQPVRGGGWQAVYGKLDDIPVFAKAGAIVPLGPMAGWGGVDNPEHLFVHIFPGSDNRFELYEDDGTSQAYKEGAFAVTVFSQEWAEDQQVFRIAAPVGDASLIPAQRTYDLNFYAIAEPAQVIVKVNGQTVPAASVYDPASKRLTLTNLVLTPADALEVTVQPAIRTAWNLDTATERTLIQMLHAFRLGNSTKEAMLHRLKQFIQTPSELAAFQVALTRTQLRAILETITRAGVERIDNIGEEPYLVFWNNDGRQDVSYLFSNEWLLELLPKFYEAEQGVLPKFKALRTDPEFEEQLPKWLLRQGKPPAVWQIHYGNLLKVVFTRKKDHEPYSRPEEGLF